MTEQEIFRKWQQVKSERAVFLKEAAEGTAYYRNENQILGRQIPVYEQQRRADALLPLRNADHRIPHNFHRLLVNQKAGYFASWAPLMDLGDREKNRLLRQKLRGLDGVFYRLSVDASNCGEGWVHHWKAKDGSFCFDRIDPREIYPIWNGSLKRELSGLFRVYGQGDRCCLEFWDERWVRFFFLGSDGLIPRQVNGKTAIQHHLGKIPFIRFVNNAEGRGDLPQYQALIDLYDQVESAFANDLEDVQQVILILRNYGGMNLSEFMQDLKKYKAVRVEGGADEGGLDTLQIEIPVAARTAMLELLRREIFAAGQGLNPFAEQVGNPSGVAMKFRYSQLEMKAMEQERGFEPGLLSLAKEAMAPEKQEEIDLTFIRNTIRSEEEQAEIAAASNGLISRYTLLANHPWVTDPAKEMERMSEEIQNEVENICS